ncbi:hypothetical protein NHJ6243_005209 [Beauveria neobassiana]
MAAIARDSSKILGLVIGDCAIEPPGLYMPPQAKPLPQIPPPRRHEPATSAVRAANLVIVASSSSDTAGVVTLEVADGSFGGICIAEYLSPNPTPGSAAPVRVLPV